MMKSIYDHTRCWRMPGMLTVMIVLFILPITATFAATPSGSDEAATRSQNLQALVVKAQEFGGKVPVIVLLKLDTALEPTLNTAAAQAQRDAIADVQQRVLSRLFATAPQSAAALQDEAALGIKRFSLTPGFAIQADAQMLNALMADPEVQEVVEDTLSRPSLPQSVPLIGGDASGTFAGKTGLGWVVAILDTGVDKTHPFLSGKVVSEACYSTNNAGAGASSVCPGGVSSSTAPGSGVNCAATIAGCDHGTHVAGIAAGKNGAYSGATFSGVARDANVIAVQVFTRFDNDTYCGTGGSPCAMSYSSDQIQGLERVYALRATYQIASVNMSLGGGEYTTYCDSAPQKPAIDNLRAVNIATVIASGNESFTAAMGAPGCISTAVSVGSTTKSDVVSSFSNSADILNLLAPGSNILSSIPGGSYSFKSGTSMATPHVTGAWAVLKQAKPNATVTELLKALVSTGKSVTDTRSGAGNRVKPRINLLSAVNSISFCPNCLPDRGGWRATLGQ